MKVKDAQFFAVVSSFLNVYLVKNRSCSSNTVKSYEDALNLFFTFLETAKAIPRQRANWSHFTRQNIQEFMDWLEKVRNCSRQTQLQRLAAIRSFVRYGGIIDLRVISIQADVEKIRYRKPAPALVGYLTKEGLSAFLSQPNCQKRTGFRNMVFLVLMYDTAARCQEMLDLRIQDLVLHRTSPCVYLTGKGNKTRVVPILPKTAEHLRSYLKKFHPADNRKRDDYVFYAYGGPQRPMSPDTVTAFVKKYGESARQACTSIPARVHPHMLRHTRAMHLYQDGVPLAMVSEFLGHAQIETTKIYAHADTEMKRKAIQQAANKLNDKMQEALSSLNWPEWLKKNDRRIFSLKTCLGSFRMTEAGHLVSSSPRFMTWGIMSNGLCLTANILESLNQDGGCSLSDILIPDAPGKYFLSLEQMQKLLYRSSMDGWANESMILPESPAHRTPADNPDSTL